MSENTDWNGSSHTLGPWAFEPVTEFPESVRPTVAVVGDVRVVRDGSSVRGYDEHGSDEADARLISAAPDMLEALTEAAARLRYSGDYFADIGAQQRAEADWAASEAAYAAISKATAHHPTSGASA